MKKIIAVMALTCATAIVSADTVTSENIVGYNKSEINTGLQLLSTGLDDGSNTVISIFGDSLPANTIVSAYVNGTGYVQSIYNVNFLGNGSWSDPQLDIGNSVGYWVNLPSGTYTNIVSGDVVSDASITNVIASGLQLMAYPYPVDVTVATAGFTPAANDILSVYVNGTGYVQSVYNVNFLGQGSWSDPNLVIGIGQGFWYNSAATTNWNWVVNKPF